MIEIYSIGYGNRRPEVFTALLQQYNIDTLVDIRTSPFSKFQPYYCRAALEELMKNSGIGYLYMGDSLGGKPQGGQYIKDGRISHELIRKSGEYNTGIEQLISLAEKETICIMCCELNPMHCHRKRLVGESLYAKGMYVKHIDEKGGILMQKKETAVLKLF